ncbi:MAG: class I SAM-dependent methyltransferase [Oscillospiraceae bacterium]|nr:class I SAM-dependent methyltransferase [Oscillospiraceae bacterium]
MNKQNIIEFFDGLAPEWDADMIRDDEKIGKILDFAGVGENKSVLDVACGTGVLVPDYLARNVGKLTGIDISSAMIEIAKSKFSDPRVTFIHGDVEELMPGELYDCCVVYNAFPHFPDPERLIKVLTGFLCSGGKLTIAHGMSREDINGHHSQVASEVSLGLMTASELSELMSLYVDVDTALSNEHMYVVSGTKR